MIDCKNYIIIKQQAWPPHKKSEIFEVWYKRHYKWCMANTKFQVAFFDRYNEITFQKESDIAMEAWENGDKDSPFITGMYEYIYDKIFKSLGIFRIQGSGVDTWWVPKDRTDIAEWLEDNFPHRSWRVSRSFIPWIFRNN